MDAFTRLMNEMAGDNVATMKAHLELYASAFRLARKSGKDDLRTIEHLLLSSELMMPPRTLAGYFAVAISMLADRPAPQPEQTDDLYLIWSHEHRAWWAPNKRGYRSDDRAAGRYTRAEADAICDARTWDKVPGLCPPEVAIVRPSDAVMASPQAAEVLRDLVARETDRRMSKAGA